MKRVCLIPARGGSKRIPRKNIRSFSGKPLIAWSIEAAIESNLFEKVYVSTDDEEIANISESCGAEVPFLRPSALSDDYSLDRDVRAHFLRWCESSDLVFDQLCYLYATAPFVTPELLRECSKTLELNEVGCVHTICSFAYPILRAVHKSSDGKIDFVWPENAFKRSQELPEYFHDAGQCYFYDLAKYPHDDSRMGLLVPRDACQDIDTPEDFEFAEKLFRCSRFLEQRP